METTQPERKHKTLHDTILGTIQDEKGNGSSKRATAFYFVVVLITSLHIALFFYLKNCPDNTITLKLMDSYLMYDLVFSSVVLGLTSFDKIFEFIKSLRGIKNESKPADPVKSDTPQ